MCGEPWRDIVIHECSSQEHPMWARKLPQFIEWCRENEPAYLPLIHTDGDTIKFATGEHPDERSAEGPPRPAKNAPPIIVCECNHRLTPDDVARTSFQPCRFASTNSRTSIRVEPPVPVAALAASRVPAVLAAQWTLLSQRRAQGCEKRHPTRT